MKKNIYGQERYSFCFREKWACWQFNHSTLIIVGYIIYHDCRFRIFKPAGWDYSATGRHLFMCVCVLTRTRTSQPLHEDQDNHPFHFPREKLPPGQSFPLTPPPRMTVITRSIASPLLLVWIRHWSEKIAYLRHT